MPRMLFDVFIFFYMLPTEVSSLEFVPLNQTSFILTFDEAISRNNLPPRYLILEEKTEQSSIDIGMADFNGSYIINNNLQEVDLCKIHSFLVRLKYEDGGEEEREYEYSPPDIAEVMIFSSINIVMTTLLYHSLITRISGDKKCLLLL